jgi:CRP-like cAMP-binding protein
MIRGSADLVSSLRETRLLQGLSPPEISALAPYVSLRPMDPGEVLFRGGEPGEALFLILEGRLEVLKEEQVIGDLLEGDHLGEGALVEPGPRQVTVRAADPSTIATLGRDPFERLAREAPALHARLLRLILRETTVKMREAEALP